MLWCCCSSIEQEPFKPTISCEHISKTIVQSSSSPFPCKAILLPSLNSEPPIIAIDCLRVDPHRPSFPPGASRLPPACCPCPTFRGSALLGLRYSMGRVPVGSHGIQRFKAPVIAIGMIALLQECIQSKRFTWQSILIYEFTIVIPKEFTRRTLHKQLTADASFCRSSGCVPHSYSFSSSFVVMSS